jgi:hypothetical protein
MSSQLGYRLSSELINFTRQTHASSHWRRLPRQRLEMLNQRLVA